MWIRDRSRGTAWRWQGPRAGRLGPAGLQIGLAGILDSPAGEESGSTGGVPRRRASWPSPFLQARTNVPPLHPSGRSADRVPCGFGARLRCGLGLSRRASSRASLRLRSRSGRASTATQQGHGPAAWPLDRFRHGRRFHRIDSSQPPSHHESASSTSALAFGNSNSSSFSQNTGGIGPRQRLQDARFLSASFLFSIGLPVRLQQPLRQGPRFLQGNRVSKHPHRVRRPLAGACQLDRDVSLAGLDQSSEEPKPLTAREEEHRPLAIKPPSVNRPSASVLVAVRSGPVARLEHLDAEHRLALPIDDPAADRAQRPLDHGEQDPRLVVDRDPVRQDRLHPRCANHDPIGRANQQVVGRLERAVSGRAESARS